jgi:hypothetical protein
METQEQEDAEIIATVASAMRGRPDQRRAMLGVHHEFQKRGIAFCDGVLEDMADQVIRHMGGAVYRANPL